MSWEWIIGTGLAVAFAAGGLAFQVKQLRNELRDVRDWVKSQGKRIGSVERDVAILHDRGRRDTAPISIGVPGSN